MTDRTRRKTRVGVVISDVRDKTVTVEVVDSKHGGRLGGSVPGPKTILVKPSWPIGSKSP